MFQSPDSGRDECRELPVAVSGDDVGRDPLIFKGRIHNQVGQQDGELGAPYIVAQSFLPAGDDFLKTSVAQSRQHGVDRFLHGRGGR